MPGVRGFWIAAGPLAERLRRRRRARQGARRARHDGRGRASTSSRTGRGASAARTATPTSPPRRARGLQVLLPAALSATTSPRPGGRGASARCTAVCRSSAPSSGRKNGWERADYFRPGEPWRRAGEDQRAFGWTRPPYHDRVAVEHAAIRERVGIIDMTSFGKLDVTGADALGAARARVRQPDRPARRRGRLHAAARRARRHRRRRDRDAARRGSLPRRHRRRRRRLRPRLARAEHAGRRRDDRAT